MVDALAGAPSLMGYPSRQKNKAITPEGL